MLPASPGALAQSAQPASPSQSVPAAQTGSVQVSNTPQGGYVLKMNGELVLTNVVPRDAKTGEVVLGLKQSDFTILENGKPQRLTPSTLRLWTERHRSMRPR
jgi:hypothetical protein